MEKLLEVKNLKTYFYTDDGIVKAVDGVDFSLGKGDTLGLVGESGCGKSVMALSLIGLVPRPGKIVGGEIYFKNRNLLDIGEEEIRGIRGKEISMIFQDPFTSLNPVFTIGEQIREAVEIHSSGPDCSVRSGAIHRTNLFCSSPLAGEVRCSSDSVSPKGIGDKGEGCSGPPACLRQADGGATKEQLFNKVVELLKLVELPFPEQYYHYYPHQLSGGMQQRAMIAMALSCNPSLLIADEPTTALDLTIQSQIIKLLQKLQAKLDMSVILITHNLGVVSEIAKSVIVMYLGRMMEYACTDDLFKNPAHPYTQGLLNAIPRVSAESKEGRRLYVIPGTVGSPLNLPSGCRFYPRCEKRIEKCLQEEPPLKEVNANHLARCWLV